MSGVVAGLRNESTGTSDDIPVVSLEVSGRRVEVARTLPAHEVDVLVLHPRGSKLGP